MKKLVLATLIAISAMLATDAFAHVRGNKDCGSCERSCGDRVCRVEEEPAGTPPCCWTAIQVPAKKVKHVRYTYECPAGCTEGPNAEL